MFWSLAPEHNELRGHEAEVFRAMFDKHSLEDFSNLWNTCYKSLIVEYICSMLHNVAVHPSPKLEISLENIQTHVRKDDVLECNRFRNGGNAQKILTSWPRFSLQ